MLVGCIEACPGLTNAFDMILDSYTDALSSHDPIPFEQLANSFIIVLPGPSLHKLCPSLPATRL
jgi:hypothetical protein